MSSLRDYSRADALALAQTCLQTFQSFLVKVLSWWPNCDEAHYRYIRTCMDKGGGERARRWREKRTRDDPMRWLKSFSPILIRGSFEWWSCSRGRIGRLKTSVYEKRWRCARRWSATAPRLNWGKFVELSFFSMVLYYYGAGNKNSPVRRIDVTTCACVRARTCAPDSRG